MEKLIKNKSYVLSFRLDENDYHKYLEKIKASGYKKSEFFRNVVLKNKTKVINKNEAIKIIYHLNKMGNNLNQQTHGLNKAFAMNKISSGLFEQNLKSLNFLLRQQRTIIDLLLYAKQGENQ